MTAPKAIYIGGTPMVGKSTVGRILASRLQYQCVSTDDIGAAITAVTDAATHPQFHYMGTQDYRDYYATTEMPKLIRDMERQHAALWPALRVLFQNHMTWGVPIIIEGWALRPNCVAELSGDIGGVFLMADDALVESRVRSSDFSAGAKDREAMLLRYIERSRRYSSAIQDDVSRLGLVGITISAEMKPDEIADECIRALDRAPAAGNRTAGTV
jgi:2-phosphoglycerate kinase